MSRAAENREMRLVAIIQADSDLALGCQRLITYPAEINPVVEAKQLAAPAAAAEEQPKDANALAVTTGVSPNEVSLSGDDGGGEMA